MLRVCEESLDEGMLVLAHAAQASYRSGAKFCALTERWERDKRDIVGRRSESPVQNIKKVIHWQRQCTKKANQRIYAPQSVSPFPQPHLS